MVVTIPEQGGSLTIRGGTGGTSVRLDSLDRAADRLAALADELSACGLRALAVLARVQASGGQFLDPAGFLAVEEAMLSATAGPHSAAVLGAGLERIASRLHATAASYRDAETAVERSFRVAEVLTGRAIGTGFLTGLPAAVPFLLPLVGPGTGLAALTGFVTAGNSRWRGGKAIPGLSQLSGLFGPGRHEASTAVLEFLSGHDAFTEHLIAVVPGVAGAFGVTPGPVDGRGLALRLLTVAGFTGLVIEQRRWFSDPPEVTVTGSRQGVITRPAAGVAGLVGGIPPSSATDPVVRIDRIDGPRGRHWVVLVPGTDTISRAPRVSPFDAAGAAGAAGGRPTAGIRAVELAMDRAGIPPGEPVLLAGHSQGGMIAAAIAADPVATQRFSITHVVTAGSPIAQTPVLPQVRVLSLEHTNDLVPLLDGAQNPDQENWTTVRAPTPLEDGASPLAGHDKARYARTAVRVDASADDSLEGWRTGTEGFLDGPGTRATSWQLHVRRG